MSRRGELWWVELPVPTGSEPGFTRPGLVVSNDRFNDSALQTVVVVLLTANPARAARPGNVLIDSEHSGLALPSVVNVTQLATVDRRALLERIGDLPDWLLAQVDDGLRLSLGLG